MSERYSRLFTLPTNLYARGAPVLIAAGALLKDNVSGGVLAQLKIRNIGVNPIKAVTVELTPADTAGRTLGEPVIYQYLDLSVERHEDFGEQTPIVFPDAAARSYTAAVKEVVFTNNRLWSANGEIWTSLPEQPTLEEHFQDDELAKQYRITYGQSCKFLTMETRDLWLCTCGTVNRREEKTCRVCGKDFAELTAGLDVSSLTAAKDARLEKERLQAKQERVAAEEKRIAAKEKAKKNKKLAAILLSVVAVVVIVAVLTVNVFIPNGKYNNAVALMDTGDYAGAFAAFQAMDGYKDSVEKLSECLTLIRQNCSTGTVAAGTLHTVGLKADGTVVAVGANIVDQCNVSDWTGIAAIAAGSSHTVGLKSDGTVVAVGSNNDDQCDVSGWTDIVAIAAGYYHTVGLKSDGTVVAVGDNGYGKCDVSDWTDIVAVSAGGSHTVGLKSDGTVVATGYNEDGRSDVSGWTDIVAVSAGGNHTVGLKSDGTVVATGYNDKGQCDVSDWTDIVTVSAGSYHTVGLKSDGTVVTVGDNGYGQCDVSDWTDIVVVVAGGGHTVGLRADDTVVATGNYGNGQCDVSNWTNIRTQN